MKRIYLALVIVVASFSLGCARKREMGTTEIASMFHKLTPSSIDALTKGRLIHVAQPGAPTEYYIYGIAPYNAALAEEMESKYKGRAGLVTMTKRIEEEFKVSIRAGGGDPNHKWFFVSIDTRVSDNSSQGNWYAGTIELFPTKEIIVITLGMF